MRALAAIQWINLAYVVKRSRGKKTLEVGMLQGERHINCEPTVAKRLEAPPFKYMCVGAGGEGRKYIFINIL